MKFGTNVIFVLPAFLSSIVSAQIPLEIYTELSRSLSLEREPALKLEGAQYILEEGDEYQKYLILDEAAIAALDSGHFDLAVQYARELLLQSENRSFGWNFGNAVFNANHILGLVSFLNEDYEKAKTYLLQAGSTVGSPQLNTFGPGMRLAFSLLEAGEEEAVIRYLELCRVFWRSEDGRIDRWIKDIEEGKIPYFEGMQVR